MQDRPYFVTPAGHQKMLAELQHLKNVKKREVAERIERAKELGDLSENAEYADAKDEMAFVEGRIIELTNALSRAKIIEAGAGDTVQVGSTVILKNGGAEKTYTIVGPGEANPAAGKISNETPLAVSLLGKKIGDSVTVAVPSGSVTYQIVRLE